jgi:ABC-type cobalamin/Fe3+-siderophores transport system ATPase subunit
MRIESLWIERYKNLQDFTFTTAEGLTTVLIGPNGTGKSNFIEAVIWIFRNLDLGEPPYFAYRITYLCRGNKISVDATGKRSERGKLRRQMEIFVNENLISTTEFSRRKDELLPANVFAYYSGSSPRQEVLFNQHFQNYYGATLKEQEMPLRRLFFCHLAHGNFALLGFFAKNDKGDQKFLLDHLGIEGIESVLFVLRHPWWFKGKPTAQQQREGDSRFWYAAGLVKKFTSRLWEHTLPPIRDEGDETLDFRGKKERKEWLYLFVPDEATLRKLAGSYGTPKDFFKELETTWINDLIAETHIRVQRKGFKEHVTFGDLSDGERQYLMVLGLLRFTREDETLFLLDEPDTHLHPRWKFEYLNTIEKCVNKEGHNQMLLATHDPLVVLSLKKDQVRLFKMDEKSKRITVSEPYQNPSDLSVETLLTSELYGLRATVAPEKLEMLDRKRLLAAKTTLNSKEKAELKELAEELGGLDATVIMRDPLYDRFVEAMTVLGYDRKILTATQTQEQREEQSELAKEVLESMKKE